MTDDYRIEVRDFGPIAEASIHVRPLTVLIGPSNAGKSYFATLLYALHRSLSGDIRAFPTDSGARAAQVEPVANSLKGWIAEAGISERLPDLPRDVAARIRALLESPTELCASITDELRRCFGTVDIQELTRRGSENASADIRLIVQFKGGIPQARYHFRFQGGKTQCASVEIGQFEELLQDLESRLQEEVFFIKGFYAANEEILRRAGREMEIDSFAKSRVRDKPSATGRLADMLGSLTNTLFNRCLNPLRRNAYYLPADRTGVMHSYPVVTSALAHSFTTAGARRSPGPVLSGVMADFFTDLARLGRTDARNHEAPPAKSAESLEEKLLGGRIRVNDGQVGNPAVTYRPDGWPDDLSLIRSSSMVTELVSSQACSVASELARSATASLQSLAIFPILSADCASHWRSWRALMRQNRLDSTLAPIVLYLRHIVETGDILIIEEPEAHLHPAMQAEIAKELARLALSGVRVVMTTHSEWILEQIGNLVRTSELPQKRRQGLVGADIALEPASVGAWLFKPESSQKGFRVEEIVLDPETGMYPTGYDAVSEALYNEGAAIFNRLPDANE